MFLILAMCLSSCLEELFVKERKLQSWVNIQYLWEKRVIDILDEFKSQSFSFSSFIESSRKSIHS